LEDILFLPWQDASSFSRMEDEGNENHCSV